MDDDHLMFSGELPVDDVTQQLFSETLLSNDDDIPENLTNILFNATIIAPFSSYHPNFYHIAGLVTKCILSLLVLVLSTTLKRDFLKIFVLFLLAPIILECGFDIYSEIKMSVTIFGVREFEWEYYRGNHYTDTLNDLQHDILKIFGEILTTYTTYNIYKCHFLPQLPIPSVQNGYVKKSLEPISDSYFTAGQIVSNILMIGRLFTAVTVLLLGIKMEKDFMRSVTITLFIPITIGELFTVYCEVTSYLKLFQPTRNLSNIFYHTICLTVQIIPLFLCILTYVSDKNHDVVLQVLSIISRIVNITCFVIISIQIFVSFVLLCRELPMEHAASVDMQIRDARSRLAWTLIYIIIPYLMLIPYFVNAIVWLMELNSTRSKQISTVNVITKLIIIIVNYYRPTWMVIITVAFLPPYRFGLGINR
uniref:G_PROTEIN_RECEP_F1_2 domain-containing protein n=1 Tax=Heterorhabditis bacteriophora TaxID=37862 RepID=A0A1I7XQZ9_HETBA